MTSGVRTASVVVAGLVGLVAAAFSQRFGARGFSSEAPESQFPTHAEFHFLRMEYKDYTGRSFGFVSRRGRASGWWAQDWPDAEEHFTTGVARLTRVNAGDPQHVGLLDETLFDYPWIYATQTGYWNLSDQEISRLREFLQRGGFLMTDDFWDRNGSIQEWEVFAEAMNRVFPGQPITDIGMDDSVMHVLYDIREKDLTFIPGSRHLGGDGKVYQPPGTDPKWRALYDEKKRMVVAVNFNTDIGDAWEFADVPYYPEAMTTLAYHYGINYLIYSMTH